MKFSLIVLMLEFFSFGSPVILTIPSQPTEGGTGVLTCDLEATVSLGSWKKGDNTASSIATCTGGGCTDLISNSRYSFTKTTTTMTLTINPLERTFDQGSWTCAQSPNFDTEDIVTIYTEASGVTVTVSDRKLTCQTSCLYPVDTSAGQFTWSYNDNNKDTTITGDAITDPTSSTDGCSNSEEKIVSILDIDKIAVNSEITVTFMVSFTQTDFTIAKESTPTQSFTLSSEGTPASTTPTPPSGPNVPLISGLVAGVVVIIIIISVCCGILICRKRNVAKKKQMHTRIEDTNEMENNVKPTVELEGAAVLEDIMLCDTEAKSNDGFIE